MQDSEATFPHMPLDDQSAKLEMSKRDLVFIVASSIAFSVCAVLVWLSHTSTSSLFSEHNRFAVILLLIIEIAADFTVLLQRDRSYYQELDPTGLRTLADLANRNEQVRIAVGRWFAAGYTMRGRELAACQEFASTIGLTVSRREFIDR